MLAGIAIDDWKEHVFVQILAEEGWEYTVKPGVTSDSRFIQVEYRPEEFLRLKATVQRCQNKAAELKG